MNMSFNWKLYVDLADELASYKTNNHLQEACLRSSISRGYYGVYCTARNFLIRQGNSIPKADSHKYVREEYQKSQDWRRKKIAKNLHRLLNERKDADYENSSNIDVKRVQIALSICRQTLAVLHQIGAN